MSRITSSDMNRAHGRGGLDPAGVEAAAAVRRMLRDIGRRAAVFAAQRQPLQQAERDQDRSARGSRSGRYVGRTPTMKVDEPMMMMVIRKVYLRPTRSPIRPNTRAPNGRTRKPAANASSAKMLRVVRGTALKNWAPMTAAREPYR